MMFSDCCGVQIVEDVAGLELCPRCWEHCDVVFEDEADYIPGADDGEWPDEDNDFDVHGEEEFA